MQLIELHDDAAEEQLWYDQHGDHDVDHLRTVEAGAYVEAEHIGETRRAEEQQPMLEMLPLHIQHRMADQHEEPGLYSGDQEQDAHLAHQVAQPAQVQEFLAGQDLPVADDLLCANGQS